MLRTTGWKSAQYAAWVGLTTLGLIAAQAPAVAVDFIVPTPPAHCAAQPETGPTSDPGVCRTDNTTWTYYMDSNGEFELEAPDRSEATAAMDQWGNNTVMNVSYDSDPTFSGPAETDVVFQEGYIPGFPDWVAGATWCVDIEDGTTWKCDSHYVRIRGNGVYEKWLAAHEAGHGLGLTHGSWADPTKSDTASIMGIMTTGSLPASLGPEPKNQVDGFYG